MAGNLQFQKQQLNHPDPHHRRSHRSPRLKHHYLKEEIVVKKKSFTEIKKINEPLRSERVTVEGATEEEVSKREDDAAVTIT